jgi:predicted enzyme related to lactoylglutathione lyase
LIFLAAYFDFFCNDKETPTMNILKPHVSLDISNIDASVAFYEEVFAVPASKRRPGYAKFDLQQPSALPGQDKPARLGKKSGCC